MTLKPRRIAPFLLLGVLSMFYAEVFSGASGVWFLDPWSLMVTFPIYLVHVLALLNIAMRLERVTLPHLYFFGALFGLYESWVTQVLWYGYYNAEQVTIVSGVAVWETIVLVLFWHPVMSFIVPILVYQLLTRSSYQRSHLHLLQDNRRNRSFAYMLVSVGSVFLCYNYGGDVVSVASVLIGSYVMIFLLMRLNSPDGGLNALRTKRVWPMVLLIVLQYAVFFILSGLVGFFTDGDPRMPTLAGVLVILALYAALTTAIIASRPETSDMVEDTRVLSLGFYRMLASFNVAFAISLCFIFSVQPILVAAAMMVLYFAMIPLGIYLLAKSLTSIKSTEPVGQ